MTFSTVGNGGEFGRFRFCSDVQYVAPLGGYFLSISVAVPSCVRTHVCSDLGSPWGRTFRCLLIDTGNGAMTNSST
ncbi:hypothetical protein E2C01_032546 [Portunus trituberculatus]|uniref:Uncharacterized protein n=1 Tax=Portunus trituberculatus TaxID=210409 RepID=A0A5B7F0K0_PORTR|nr:hypothetical protein [Portunus trituberculatus]